MPLSNLDRSCLPAPAAEYIAALEQCLRDIIALERTSAPDMSGKRRKWAYIRPGASLAAVLDHARAVLGDLDAP